MRRRSVGEIAEEDKEMPGKGAGWRKAWPEKDEEEEEKGAQSDRRAQWEVMAAIAFGGKYCGASLRGLYRTPLYTNDPSFKLKKNPQNRLLFFF